MDRVNPLATLSMPLLDEDMRRFEPLLAELLEFDALAKRAR